ncbi:hypothetical protein RIF29_38177 [Crotalaria pallida]|uniref:Uncharacterized protein n=1 Tax=Crotalaria pallida TaxID=3830 RepID=A0AAN9E540_CROPI
MIGHLSSFLDFLLISENITLAKSLELHHVMCAHSRDKASRQIHLPLPWLTPHLSPPFSLSPHLTVESRTPPSEP